MTISIKYTPEQENELREEYVKFDTHDNREDYILKFMKKYDKSKSSVIAKLSRMKTTGGDPIYIKRPKLSKVTNEEAKTKAQMVAEATMALGFSTGELEGFGNTPKLVLVKMLERFKELTANQK